jgi:hypothetical protein
MISRLLGLFNGSDPLVRAGRSSDREAFAHLFGRSNVIFVQLPPGLEDGLSPDLTQEELLEQIKRAAKDLSGREQFTPFRQLREGRNSMVVFTQQRFAEGFAHAYVRRVKRIMPFQALTVQGSVLAPAFGDVDTIVLNPDSKQEYEVPVEDMPLFRKICVELHPAR